MNNREREILKAIISHYLQYGESVGSRTIEKKYNMGVSSATIRNVMSDLEDMGLIKKMHTSSGRIPTTDGYKMYIEELIQIREISTDIKKQITDTYTNKINKIDKIFQETSKLLSVLSEYTGVVLEPIIKDEYIKKVEFVQISKKHIFIVIILNNNITKTANLYLDYDIDEYGLRKASKYLNDIIVDNSKFNLQDLEKFLLKIGKLDQTFTDEDMMNNERVFMEGSINLIEKIQDNAIKVMDTVRILANREEIKNVFKSFLDSGDYPPGGVNIIFGEDLGKEEYKDFSFVFSVYEIGDDKGIIGVIGPKNMEYSKTLGLVEYVSNMVEEVLEEKLGIHFIDK